MEYSVVLTKKPVKSVRFDEIEVGHLVKTDWASDRYGPKDRNNDYGVKVSATRVFWRTPFQNRAENIVTEPAPGCKMFDHGTYRGEFKEKSEHLSGDAGWDYIRKNPGVYRSANDDYPNDKLISLDNGIVIDNILGRWTETNGLGSWVVKRTDETAIITITAPVRTITV